MEQVVVTIELHQSILECQKELLFIVAEPELKTCHGIVKIRKELDIDDERGDLMMKMRKRRPPSNVVVSERKRKRYECGYCEYESRAQYNTARHVARVHQCSIKPTKCDLCPIRTIYRSNLKRHQESMHNTFRLKWEWLSESKSSESRLKSSASESKFKSSESSVVSLN